MEIDAILPGATAVLLSKYIDKATSHDYSKASMQGQRQVMQTEH